MVFPPGGPLKHRKPGIDRSSQDENNGPDSDNQQNCGGKRFVSSTVLDLLTVAQALLLAWGRRHQILSCDKRYGLEVKSMRDVVPLDQYDLCPLPSELGMRLPVLETSRCTKRVFREQVEPLQF
jgi:hypothetical protein